MQINRRYKKLLWFDLLDVIKKELSKNPDQVVYLELMDEFRMRLLESVSEGGTFKLKVQAKELLTKFEKRLSEDPLFATKVHHNEIRELAEMIL